MIFLIVAMPIIQLVILSSAANYEIENINLHVTNCDLSTASQLLVGKFQASTYFSIVNSSFSTKVAMKDIESDKADLFLDIPPNIEIPFSNWFNPDLNYKNYMVSGILVMLVTMIGMFLSAMNIVKEKEIGTIEQLNVTPIKKYQFVIGKLMPFWIIGLFEMGFGLAVGKIAFGDFELSETELMLIINY